MQTGLCARLRIVNTHCAGEVGKYVKDPGAVGSFVSQVTVARTYYSNPAIGKASPRPRILKQVTNFHTGVKLASTELVEVYPTSPRKSDFSVDTRSRKF